MSMVNEILIENTEKLLELQDKDIIDLKKDVFRAEQNLRIAKTSLLLAESRRDNLAKNLRELHDKSIEMWYNTPEGNPR